MGLCSCSAPCNSQLQQDMCVLGKSCCIMCSRQPCLQCSHNTNSHVCIMLLCIPYMLAGMRSPVLVLPAALSAFIA